MVEALCKEVELRKAYLPSADIQTIYYGGGTPSLLNDKELELIFNTIQKHFSIGDDVEITLEANPDDLSAARLQMLSHSPVNRLSIGVQSFFEEDLQFMNRAHNALEATRCIQLAQEVGFEQLSIDLIYGAPTTTNERWAANVKKLIDWQIPHLSCYCLTVEPGTALDHFVKKGKAAPVNEEKAALQFNYLMDTLHQAGYEHYEISNFAKPNKYARHNTNYWRGIPYLGIGPSAHSFDGPSRQWNIANNAQYLKAIDKGQPFFEREILSFADQYNEYIMTALRTQWGVDILKIEREWGAEISRNFKNGIEPVINRGEAVHQENYYVLTPQGRLLADGIAGSLFVAT